MKVVRIDDALYFDDGTMLFSSHQQDCCENHYLDFSNLMMDDFEGLEFDLSGEDFFERVENYGIALKPIKGLPVRIPGYGSNNGYYSTNLTLCLSGPITKEFDITNCQEVNN